jgi:hypothetical protein
MTHLRQLLEGALGSYLARHFEKVRAEAKEDALNMPITELDPVTALVVIDLQRGIVARLG